MTTPWPPRRRPLAPCVAAPREPVDPARIGRRVVRRRAKGMDAAPSPAPSKNARFDARQASRHEDLADDERDRRSWRSGSASTNSSPPPRRAPRTTRAPTTSSRPSSPPRPRPPPNGRPPYARRSGSRPAPTSSRHCANWAHWSRPSPARATKPSATNSPPRRGQADIDAWLARALAAHRGHYAHPAAREAAAGLLPQPVLAHAALLSALARPAPAAAPGELAVAARLAAAEPETTADLAALLTRATEPGDPAGSPA